MGFDATTQITINNVACWDEGTEEHFGRDRNSTYTVRKLRKEWASRAQLVAALQSGSQQIGTVTIITGAQLYPGYNNLYVDTIDITGEGKLTSTNVTGNGLPGAGTGPLVSYQWAILNVRYTPMDLTTGQQELDFGKDILSLPQEAIQFAGGNPVAQGMSVPVPVVCFTQTRFFVPNLPVAAILAATDNPINSQQIFGASAGKILFDGGRSLSRFGVAQGNNLNDLTYRFLYRPIEWDKLYDPTDNTWKKVQTRDGSPVIGRSDLNALFA